VLLAGAALPSFFREIRVNSTDTSTGAIARAAEVERHNREESGTKMGKNFTDYMMKKSFAIFCNLSQ